MARPMSAPATPATPAASAAPTVPLVVTRELPRGRRPARDRSGLLVELWLRSHTWLVYVFLYLPIGIGLAGMLVKVGKGDVTVEQFRDLVRGDLPRKLEVASKLDIAAWTAPASGLFLEGIRYI